MEEKQMQCNDCKKMLPSDSEFCQYCGSKNISVYIKPKPATIVTTKKCNQCGKELPDDSEFCQYCGSKNIVIKESVIGLDEQETNINKDVTQQKPTTNDNSSSNYRIAFLVALLCIFALIATLVNITAKKNQTVSVPVTDNLKEKADNYDKFVFASKSHRESTTDFSTSSSNLTDKNTPTTDLSTLLSNLTDKNKLTHTGKMFVSKTVIYIPNEDSFFVF